MSRLMQRGATLISTMIGLLLGLFAVLSVMTLYKTQVNQTFQTRTNTSIDGQVAAALMTTQLEVQRAGFGVEVVAAVSPAVTPNSCLGTATAGPNGTANTDVVLLSGATLTGNTLAGTAQTIGMTAVTGNAVVWHSVDASAASTCSGLIAVGGGLKLLPSVTCTDATTWASWTWTAASVQDVVVPGTLSAGKAMAFSAKMASCTPFGRGTLSSVLELTTSVGQSVNNITSSAISCIPNICR